MSEDSSLIGQINAFVQQQDFQLPVFSQIALRVLKIARQEEYDIQQISQLIYKDQVLVTEVLKAANSAFFGGLTEITTIKDAVVRLGAMQVANLVLMASQKSQFVAKDKEFGQLLDKLWQHSVACAIGSQWLARKLNYSEMDNEAFIGGLIHDIGKLFLLRAIDAMQAAGSLPFEISVDFSHEIFNSFHCEEGYKLLKQWNLPRVYCEIARDHHNDDFDQLNIPLLLVRITNLACVKLGIGIEHDPSIVLVSTPESLALRAKEVPLAELEVMLEDTMQIA